MLLPHPLPAQISDHGLPADPRLDRPLAFEARIEPLADLVPRIGASLGTPLTVERRIGGWKASIFTPARPARLTLAGLASVFDAEWTPVKGGGYRLEERPVARNRREAHLTREEDLRRAQVVARFAQAPTVPAFGPTGDAARDAAAERTIESLREDLPRQRSHASVFNALTPLERERLWNGERFRLAGWSASPPGPVVLGPGLAAAMGADRPPEPSLSPGRSGSTLTLMSYVSGERGLRLGLYQPSGVTAQNVGTVVPYDLPALVKTAFREAQNAWASDLGATSAVLDAPLRDVPPEPPRWFGGRLTNDDLLRTLALRSGVPIVAETDRAVVAYGTDPMRAFPTATTLGGALRAPNAPYGGFRVAADGLLFRPSGFWRTRRIDPAEAALRPVETDVPPTMDAIATYFASLSRATLASPFPYATKYELTDRTGRSQETLRLWGRLPLGLRDRLRRGERLSLEALPRDVLTAIEEAVFEGILANEAQFVENPPVAVASAPIPAGSDTGRTQVGSGAIESTIRPLPPGSSIPPRPTPEDAPPSLQNRRVPLLLSLLGLRPADGFTLSAELDSTRYPAIDTPATGPGADRGLALLLRNAKGEGYRLFSSLPSGPR